ncbi:MAG: putative quinol monooxygenase [Bacillota bacterium]
MNNFVVTVKFIVYPEKIDEFIPIMMKNARESLFEEGCSVFDVSKMDNTVYLYEVYKSEQSFKEHMETKHFKEFDKITESMIKNKIVETFFMIEK